MLSAAVVIASISGYHHCGKGGNVREIQKAYKHKSKVNKRRKKKKEDIKRERCVYRGGYGHL